MLRILKKNDKILIFVDNTFYFKIRDSASLAEKLFDYAMVTNFPYKLKLNYSSIR